MALCVHVELTPKENLKNGKSIFIFAVIYIYTFFSTFIVTLEVINLTFVFGITLLRGSVAPLPSVAGRCGSP